MIDDDFRVEMIGHATLRVQSGGRTLLTDPWLIDPIGCNSGFHFPPLVHDLATLAAEDEREREGGLSRPSRPLQERRAAPPQAAADERIEPLHARGQELELLGV
jgi:hypothetical protein